MLVFIYWNLRILKGVPDFPDGGDENGGNNAEIIETEDKEYGEDNEEDLYIVDRDLF